MKKTFSYNLPIEVIRYLSNEIAMEVYGYTITSVGGFVNLSLYDQDEIERCKSDFRDFMTNAKSHGRLTSAVA